MPKVLDGVDVPEKYWDLAKKQTRAQGLSIKKDKDKFYAYAMGILKTMMKNKIEETVVAGDVAVPTCPVTGKPMKMKKKQKKQQKWVELLKDK